jgi:hypothetical protein
LNPFSNNPGTIISLARKRGNAVYPENYPIIFVGFVGRKKLLAPTADGLKASGKEAGT